jgi:subtilase family serine protease
MTMGRSAAIVALAMAALGLAGFSGGVSTRHGGGPLAAQVPYHAAFDQPESTQDCTTDPDLPGIRCYSPFQLAHAYGLDQLYAAGIDGHGTTIAIILPFGSPTIKADLSTFDQTFGVTGAPGITPYPPIAQAPHLDIRQVPGLPPVPPFDLDTMGFWAGEATLDVEWAHVFAPKANILLVPTPVDEDEGPGGFKEIEAAEKYVADHNLADVIVQTFGATEQTFPSPQSIMSFRDGLIAAQKKNITVVNASGDTGTTNFDINDELYTMQVNGWPSTDPLVTTVGGTELSLDPSGNRTSPDVVWNDSELLGQPFASGGGLSTVFSRPKFQDGVKSIVGNARGTPDVSFSSGIDGAVWTVETFFDGTVSYDLNGGTSAGTPEFGGVVALAAQVAGSSLGTIDDELYSMPYGGGLVDVTIGDNDPHFAGVPGFSATPGYDLASGLGTVDPLRFVPTLAATAACGNGPGPPGPGGAGCHGPDKNGDCSSALTFAAFTGDLHVRKGATCTLTDSAVDGNVKVDDGATLVLNGVTLGGNLNVGKKATCTANGGANFIDGKVTGPGQCPGL